MKWNRRRLWQGTPYTFNEFVFFSPKQFDDAVQYEDKDFLFKIKICTNSGRAYTGPFIDDVTGEYEVNNRELKKMLHMVNETPGLIMCGTEYTIHDSTVDGLHQYYGKQVKPQGDN